jgi:hypothetical protein
MTFAQRFGNPPTLWVSGTVAAAGPTTLIQTPGAGKRIVITAFQLQNESSTATTIILMADGAEFWRVLGQNQGDGCGYPIADLRMPTNTALRIKLSGTNACGYNIGYNIENVG